jgi:hypothetical protein
MNTPQRALGTVLEILQMIGLDVTHQYEDLVFASHNLFILKFTDDPEQVHLYFNEEVDEGKAQEVMEQLQMAGALHGLSIGYKGAYALSENSDDSLSVEFFDLTDP